MITIASFLVCFFFFTETSFAASEEQIKQVLLENYDIFRCNTIFSSAIRWIGWAVISILALIGAACAELFDKAFLFVDFTQNPQMEQYIELFDTVFIALICLSLIALGLILIFGMKKTKICHEFSDCSFDSKQWFRDSIPDESVFGR